MQCGMIDVKGLVASCIKGPSYEGPKIYLPRWRLCDIKIACAAGAVLSLISNI